MSINVVIIEGRLTKDSEVGKTKASGKPVTKMRIAHNEWNKAEQKEEAKFFNVKVFKEMPLPKGTPVMVKGKLDQFQYVADDGTNKDYTYIVAFEAFPFHIVKKESTTDMATRVFSGGSMDDNIPF